MIPQALVSFVVKMLTQNRDCLTHMTRRAAGVSRPGLFLTLGALAAVMFAGGEASISRTAFVIATGPTGGTYFPVGEAIASILSHPPGVYRCEKADVCGPSGLIASVRTSPGAVFNVLAVNARTVDAALAQSDVVADAVAGRAAFRTAGAQTHVRVLANLFPEDVHLLAMPAAHIKSAGDLKGKRVSLGPSTSGTAVTAREVLAAFHVPLSRIRQNGDSADIAAEKLSRQELDAMFFVGGAPVPLARELLESGKAVLVPIGGSAGARALKQSHALTASIIPAGLYPRTGATQTVGVHAVLIVNDSISDATAYAILKSLFNPANRNALTGSHRSAQVIRIGTATADLPAPLHPGALRFYRALGVLHATEAKSGKT
ncbi:MAG: TAXI family TRAP transporter solute-binding subunit [Alphaproteobacteria bacterium]